MGKFKHKLSNNKQGFTIVELLIIIVVVVILAALTIVGYNGIQQRATVATIQTDLHTSAVSLANDNTISGAYPASQSLANEGKGLYKSPGTTYQYTYDSSTNGYCLTATNGALSYYITSSNNVAIKGACVGHVDAAAPPATKWTQILAGDSFSAALRSDNIIYAWGLNPTGQFGNNATSSTAASLPAAAVMTGVTSGQTITKFGSTTSSSSNGTVFAIDSAGSVYGWGYNNSGQVGTGNTTSPVKVPTKITALTGKTITQIAGGLWHAVALDSTGKVYAWGDNTTAGQLGNGTNTNSLTPINITGGALAGKTITGVAAGFFHSLALDSTGKVYAWGDNTYGQLGTGSTGGQQTLPVAVSTSGALSGKTIIAIAASGRISMALDSNGQLYAWGYNSSGEVGDGTASVRNAPFAVTTGALSGKTITAMSSATGKSMALDSSGQVYAWGNNTYGQLGDGTTVNRTTPVAVTGLSGKTIKVISSSASHSLAIDSDGTAWAWGLNTSGQLGDGTITNRSTPVQVSTP